MAVAKYKIVKENGQILVKIDREDFIKFFKRKSCKVLVETTTELAKELELIRKGKKEI